MPSAKSASSARSASAARSGSPAGSAPSGSSPVALVTGPEEFLADRAVRDIAARARAEDPGTETHEIPASGLAPGVLATLVSPSLFGARKVVVLWGVQDLPTAVQPEVKDYLAAPFDDMVLVLVHAGGAKGKGMLDAARAAGAREIVCAKVTAAKDRLAFIRAEFRAAGRTVGEEAARALLDAVGNDLRELASACGQLAADTEGAISEEVIARYYTGRAETTSFAVADLTVEGRTSEALESLRWALSVGVAPVLITSALAQGVRNIARLGAAPRGMRPADLARELGMPPWKVDRVRQQLRGWTGEGITAAVRAVAAADAEVKGGGQDPAYALEKAVVTVSAARRGR